MRYRALVFGGVCLFLSGPHYVSCAPPLFISGETGLEGSGEIRSQNEADHGVERPKGEKKDAMTDKKKEVPRKVDCKFVVSVERMKQWEFVTISNCEMKSLRSAASEVEIMVRINIRHNHLIVNRIGARKMYFLNMHAYSASLKSLNEHDGVHVCGKVLDHDLLVPTNTLELECFMDGRTLAVLLTLRVCDFFLMLMLLLLLKGLHSRLIRKKSSFFVGYDSNSYSSFRLDENSLFKD
ncbi:MAG: hypothetical protein J3R72DRAFT_263824 [Linnemannia gamsii]|nr:MAG: hypothetical protein J3R72DRAFT_263824 [Linnemannia gamsii]